MTDLAAAIASARAQHRAGGGAVLDILLRSAGASAEELATQLRQRAGVDVLTDAGGHRPDFSSWDAASARQSRCLVVRTTNGELRIAAEDPWDEALLQRVARRIGRQALAVAATRSAMQALLGEDGMASSAVASGGSHAAADGPIVQFVDQALQAGFKGGASDVHFECDRQGVTVKHRLDGVMTHFARLDGVERAQEVVSRIKVLAQLDITERRLPQDGRFRYRMGEGEVDLRVSIMPSVHGEDAVLRLLDKAQLRAGQSAVTLDLLGFPEAEAARIRELANAPSGMLLVTGPTGSGKTTTVYAALSEINTGLEKIITIEDPVEYELTGVLQIPVNERKGLTFAKGLRSILRHDPDRILVGEIRDAETAEIAVQSALTGHLVFTTVHANSVADIIGRFRHFDIDMFGFMSSLNGVVVQRLVRRLCPHCAGHRAASGPEREWFARVAPKLAVEDVPVPVGCPECHGAGYKGRFVVAEVHVVDDALRDRVTEGAPLSAIKVHASERGIEALQAQAARYVLARQTTLEEVKRVVGWL